MNPAGSTLGKYQIIREIARSNDIVYEGYDPAMNRRVAIKELNLPAGSTEQQKNDRLDRFNREAKALGTLQNPNVMTIYEMGAQDDRHYIVMEFLDGCTLREKMDSKGKFDATETFDILKEVLKGLGYAHSKGVIHRDVKPDNIQILSDGRIKITDFGIARLVFEPNITIDGQTFGTPSYMSPEQVIGKEIDFRSDLFSVGAIAYEMLAGHKPFTGDSVMAISHAILNVNPPPLSNEPYAVDHVVHKALEKSPALRYGSADEMIQGMDSALGAQNANPWGTQTMAQTAGYDPFAQPTGPGQPYNFFAPNTGNAHSAHTVSSPPPVISQPFTGTFAGAPQAMAPPAVPYYGNQTAYQSYASPGYNQVVNAPYMPSPTTSGQYGYVPNPGGQPIYVVRPKKVMSNETKGFFRNLGWAVLLLGTFILVLVFLVDAVGGTIHSMKVREEDSQRAQYVQQSTQQMPLNQRIDKVQQSVQQITSPVIKEEQNRYLASLYSMRAAGASSVENYAVAEEALKAAQSIDPQNGQYAMDLANVYQAVAKSVQDAQNRALLWQASATQWIYASNAAGSESDRHQFQDNAIRADLSGARDFLNSGNYSAAQTILDHAAEFNSTDPSIRAQVRQVRKTLESRSPQSSTVND